MYLFTEQLVVTAIYVNVTFQGGIHGIHGFQFGRMELSNFQNLELLDTTT